MEIINFVAFNADVWGTVSDWIIVIVTSSTAIYLVKTFKSQKTIEDLQQELNKYESIRITSEMQPLFSVQLTSHNNDTVEEEGEVL